MRLARPLLTTLLFAGTARALVAQLPAGEPDARARIDASPRHGEWVMYQAGDGDSVRAWVVFPERRDRAPVVLVIHEIFGLTDWIRGVADQLAAEGFIAVAPDLLSGKAANGGGTEAMERQQATAAIRQVTREERNRRLIAAARYATALPAAQARVGVIGFCWGGSASFTLAADWPDLRAAVVYYGSSPDSASLERVRAPVLGLYGGDDARVNATVPPAQARLEALGRRFEVQTYDGAGHGFLRDQAGREGANGRAAAQAWPRMAAFLREHLGR